MFAVQPPEDPSGKDHPLLVYLHGMGSNYMEPFMYPTKENTMAAGFAKRWPKLCLLSCSYRQQAAWGNDKAMADISQNIREVMQQFPINKIVIGGTSMGGGSALTYAIEAPPDIKEKIVGVVSVEGTGDLAELYNTTHSPQVKSAIAKAFGATPDENKELYARKSFVRNIDKLAPKTRVAVVSALQDDVVPTALQTKIVDALKEAHRPFHYITVNTPHAVPSVDVYIEALAFALGED
jgi:dienelactone hydrolase